MATIHLCPVRAGHHVTARPSSNSPAGRVHRAHWPDEDTHPLGRQVARPGYMSKLTDGEPGSHEGMVKG